MKEPLWRPSADRVKKANMTRFMQTVNQSHGTDFKTYTDLYRWSVENIPEFWETMWDFAGITAARRFDTVIDDLSRMPGARWFVGARLNFAENLLRYRDDRVALIFRGEGRPSTRMTYRELYGSVARLASSLRDLGIGPNDRVAGFMPNMIETVVAMLAATSLGATWSSCSPDFGIKGVIDRFGQITPRVLFTADGYLYNGKCFDSLGRISEVLRQLPSIEKVVVVPYVEERPDIGSLPGGVLYGDLVGKGGDLEIVFEQVPSDHPLYIMYSSGTTGLPKCMVQGVAGILLNQLKELQLHTDLKREDTIFYFTTCGWMMWNWLVASLALGSTIVLYDGSPFYPDPEGLWRLAQDEGITIFGTSARYIDALEKAGVRPGRNYPQDLLCRERGLSMSTGRSSRTFNWPLSRVGQTSTGVLPWEIRSVLSMPGSFRAADWV
jgi:acetoacetyl-CoA synthetase